jgi:DNA polymerase bacteriophage-type
MLFGLTNKIIVLDAETSSAVDLTNRGAANYWADPSTRTLMFGVRTYKGPPASVWQARREPFPDSLKAAAAAPPEDCMFAAFNAGFDRKALIQLGIETPIEKWLDIMTVAYMLSFAGGLDAVLGAFDRGVKKNPRGKALIKKFSVAREPWHRWPAEWEEFVGYCKEDVDVEHALLEKCGRWLDTPAFHPMVQTVHRQWCLDQRKNARGMPVSEDRVFNSIKLLEIETQRLTAWVKEKTGLDNPNSRDQLLQWCKDNGAALPNLQKATVLSALEWAPEPVREVLNTRLQTGKASVKKYAAFAAKMLHGRIHDAYTTYGASRTGRAASRGGVNLANVERPTIAVPGFAATLIERGEFDALRMFYDEKPPIDVLGSCIRAALKAPEGKGFTVFDLKSIESVGLAWLAGCKIILDLFFEGKDTYKFFASLYYHILYEEVTKQQRNFSKPPFLGFGYGASGYALVEYAAGMGIVMDIEEANEAIRICRETFIEIPVFWVNSEDAAKSAVRNPGATFSVFPIKELAKPAKWMKPWQQKEYARRNSTYGEWPRIDYYCDGTFLYCGLPSGRTLFYYKPVIKTQTRTGYDGRKFAAENIFYSGKKQDDGGKWFDTDRDGGISTHGGMLAENVTQAVCRDVLYAALERVDADPDFELVGDTYDEIITLTAIDKDLGGKLAKYLTTKTPWMNDRFFLGCEGYVNQPEYKK